MTGPVSTRAARRGRSGYRRRRTGLEGLCGPALRTIDPHNKKPRSVSGGASFLFLFIKRGNCKFGRWVLLVLLLLDLDLFVFGIVVLLASKSSHTRCVRPNAVTLRLGTTYKARAVPSDRAEVGINKLALHSLVQKYTFSHFCKENRQNYEPETGSFPSNPIQASEKSPDCPGKAKTRQFPRFRSRRRR